MRHSLFAKIPSLGVVLILAACTTTDPYSGETKTSQTAKGATIGAVVGAVAGAIVNDDDRGTGAAVGAVLGAGVGGGIGYYMDRQEAALRERLARTGVEVNRVGDKIELVMPSSITFASNSSYIEQDFYNSLNGVSEVLTEFDQTTIEVEGHTDSRGTDEYNTALSVQRAESVGNYLASQGVTPGRINALGYGEREPVANNDTDAGRAENRRVEINITPVDESAFRG